MSSSNQEFEAHPEDVQPDVTPKANMVIWSCFLLLIVILYFSIASLNAYFRYEVEEEKYQKVGSVAPLELEQLRNFEAQVLSGEAPLVVGQKNISIEQAMNQIIEANFQARE